MDTVVVVCLVWFMSEFSIMCSPHISALVVVVGSTQRCQIDIRSGLFRNHRKYCEALFRDFPTGWRRRLSYVSFQHWGLIGSVLGSLLSSVYLRYSDLTREAVGAIDTDLSITGSMMWAAISIACTNFLIMWLIRDFRAVNSRLSASLTWAVTVPSSCFEMTSTTGNRIPVIESCKRFWSFVQNTKRHFSKILVVFLEMTALATEWNLTSCWVLCVSVILLVFLYIFHCVRPVGFPCYSDGFNSRDVWGLHLQIGDQRAK